MWKACHEIDFGPRTKIFAEVENEKTIQEQLKNNSVY